jgi:hypothetical protein
MGRAQLVSGSRKNWTISPVTDFAICTAFVNIRAPFLIGLKVRDALV